MPAGDTKRRPDLCLTIAALLAYAATVLALCWAVLEKLQVRVPNIL